MKGISFIKNKSILISIWNIFEIIDRSVPSNSKKYLLLYVWLFQYDDSILVSIKHDYNQHLW